MLYISEDTEVEAWVETLQDRKRLTEHREMSDDDDITGKAFAKRTSYLECEEGKSFSIRFKCLRRNPLYPDFRVGVKIDGREVGGRAWMAKREQTDVARMYVSEGGITRLANLSFASLPKTDEEDQVEIRGSAVDRLGKIVVTIERGNYTSRSNSTVKRCTDAQVGVVHEKELKLGSTIQPANVRAMAKGRMSWKLEPAKVDPFVCCFIWNYHTRAKLSIMGIIEEAAPAPISHSTAPLAVASGPIGSAGWAVKRELNVEAAGQVEVVKRVKKEKKGLGSENKPIVVSDGKFGGIGVIDLTDD